ncbi:SocA family protein [Listeria innocua]|nr:SocA family protein [Listeria innocua]
MKTYLADSVAGYIIDYCREKEYELNNLKLQKLLYYAQAKFLVSKSRPLFEEAIEKWKLGPVVPEVYHIYKSYGAKNIISPEKRIEIIFNKKGELKFENIILEEISTEDKQILNMVIDKYATFNPFELVNMTHRHEIWKKDKEKIQDGQITVKYSNKEIREFFSKYPKELV